jgi:hypothetical protein
MPREPAIFKFGVWDFSKSERVLMAPSGQKAKYSLRAHRVRFAPESGLKSDIGGGPLRADIVAKVFLGRRTKILEPLMRFTRGDVRDHMVKLYQLL